MRPIHSEDMPGVQGEAKTEGREGCHKLWTKLKKLKTRAMVVTAQYKGRGGD